MWRNPPFGSLVPAGLPQRLAPDPARLTGLARLAEWWTGLEPAQEVTAALVLGHPGLRQTLCFDCHPISQEHLFSGSGAGQGRFLLGGDKSGPVRVPSRIST